MYRYIFQSHGAYWGMASKVWTFCVSDINSPYEWGHGCVICSLTNGLINSNASTTLKQHVEELDMHKNTHKQRKVLSCSMAACAFLEKNKTPFKLFMLHVSLTTFQPFHLVPTAKALHWEYCHCCFHHGSHWCDRWSCRWCDRRWVLWWQALLLRSADGTDGLTKRNVPIDSWDRFYMHPKGSALFFFKHHVVFVWEGLHVWV